MKCEYCEAETRILEGQSYHYTESGLDNVWLLNIRVRECPHCDTRNPLIPAMDRVHDALAGAIALKPAPLAGPELRFLRRQLGYSAVKWAAIMHVTPETLSRWENGATPIGAQSDALARLFHVRIREERTRAFVDDPVAEQVERLDFTHSAAQCFYIDAQDPSRVTYRAVPV